jgi:hypothetical protein
MGGGYKQPYVHSYHRNGTAAGRHTFGNKVKKAGPEGTAKFG